MKNFKLTAILAIAFLLFNCSTEDTNNPVEEQSMTVEQTDTRGLLDGDDPLEDHVDSIEVLVVWEAGISHQEKRVTRDSFGLISYEPCKRDLSGLSEVWTMVYCDYCIPNVADPADDDDVERTTMYSSCQ